MTTHRTRLVLAALAATVGLVIVVALLGPPPVGGWLHVHVVSGTSMQPTYETGDLLVSLQRGDYGPGDAIVFGTETIDVVHRVVDGDGVNGYVTIGDNRAEVDPWRPTDADVRGHPVLHVPALGTVVRRAQTALGAQGLGLLSIVLLLAAARPRGHERRAHDPWSSAVRAAAVAGAGTAVLGASLVLLVLRDGAPTPLARAGVAAGLLGTATLLASIATGALAHVRLRTAAIDLALGTRVVDVTELATGSLPVARATGARALRRAADRAAAPVLRLDLEDDVTTYAVVDDRLALTLTVAPAGATTTAPHAEPAT